MRKMMLLVSFTVVTAIAAGPPEPNVHLNMSHSGDAKVSGRVVMRGNTVVQITRTHPDGHADQLKVVPDSSGAFAGTLPGGEKLAPGDKVTATVVPAAAANPATPAANPATPPADAAKLPNVVSVLPSTPPIIRFEKAIDQARGSKINVVITKTTDAAAWPAALLGNQTVTVIADDAVQLAGAVALPMPPDASTLSVALAPAAAAEDSDTITIEDALCEWGRVRCYAYFGVIFSQKNSDLSKTDPYLDFSLEYNWLKTKHSFVTAFFDTRLTQIPAADPAPDTTDTTQTQMTAKVQRRDATTPTTDTSAASAFATSAKSPQVMGGAYWAPYVPDQFVWEYQGQKYGMFPALIYKGGVQGRIDGALDASNLAFPNQGKSTFTFNAAGVRLGFVKWYTDDDADPHKHEAHDLLSYIDITLGKYRLYDFVGPDFGSPSASGGGLSDVRHYGLRKVFEGRLKVPRVNLQLGFDANLGQGQNDLRFSVTTNGIDLFKELLGMK